MKHTTWKIFAEITIALLTDLISPPKAFRLVVGGQKMKPAAIGFENISSAIAM